MFTQQNKGKTPMSSILQASQNRNASNANILKLTQENIRSTIPNERDYRRNPNSEYSEYSEYSVPMHDTRSIASTRSRNRTSDIYKTYHKNDDDNISVLSFNSAYSAKSSNKGRFNDDDDNVSVMSLQSTFSEYTNNDNKTITKDTLAKSKKTISNLPNDIYKLLKTFHNTKDDDKYRSKFQIPSEFNIYYYLLRYPRFGNIYDYNYKKVVGLYKHYYEVAKRTHPMDDKYYRIRYSIPDIFSHTTYYERYQTELNNIELKSDNISVYRYYYRHGFKSFPLDTFYLRLYMKIHKYFDIQILFKRYSELKDYEETFNTNNEIEVYNFYNSINKDKFCLDDQYFRLFFHTPNDFEIESYRQRYHHASEINALRKQEYCETYAHFEKSGKISYVLDEKYYFILHSIPQDFDCSVYKKRYPEKFEENDDYVKITTFYANYKESCSLDEKYYFILHSIPQDFDCSVYKKRYPEKFEENDDYVQITTFYANNKESCSLDEKYYFIYHSIPQDFDCSVYKKRYPEKFEENDGYEQITAFYANNKESCSLDEKYYFIYHSIPQDFDCSDYKKRYPEKFEENDDYVKITTFYANNKESCSLDEKYYFIYHSIPQDFDCSVYKKRYPEKFEENDGYEQITAFYANNKESCSLDEKYYFIYHSIPQDFDCSVYKERYPEKFEENDDYVKITTFYANNKESCSLDEKYYEIKYKIQDDFNWKKYGEAFLNFLDNMEDSRNMGKMYRLYHEKFHEKHEKKIYEYYLILKNDLTNINKELYNKLYLFMLDDVDDETFIRFCEWKYNYNDIYVAMLNGKMKGHEQFVCGMSILLRKCNFTNERDYRIFIKINNFFKLEKYYQEPKSKYITEKYTEKVFVENKPTYRARYVEKKVEELTREELGQEKVNSNEDMEKLNNIIAQRNIGEVLNSEVLSSEPINNISNSAAFGNSRIAKAIFTINNNRKKTTNPINKEEGQMKNNNDDDDINPINKEEGQMKNNNDDDDINPKNKLNNLLQKISTGVNQGIDLQQIESELKQEHSS